MAMQFRPLSNPPKGFTHCLIKRSLDTYLEVNGQIQYGLKERRSQIIISLYTGLHWIGRESHWDGWAAIPSESDSCWQSAKLFIPESNKPVLTILPQPIFLKSLAIPAGLHFGIYDEDKTTWKIYQRDKGARNNSINKNWIDIGNKKLSSWLELPPLDEKLRSDIH